MAEFTIKSPEELAAEDAARRRGATQRQRRSAPPKSSAPAAPAKRTPPRVFEYGPFSVVQAHVVRALVPAGRRLEIQPPNSGRVLIPPRGEVRVKFATFSRLQQMGALDQLSSSGSFQVYALNDAGRKLWDEHCRIEGKPRYDPEID